MTPGQLADGEGILVAMSNTLPNCLCIRCAPVHEWLVRHAEALFAAAKERDALKAQVVELAAALETARELMKWSDEEVADNGYKYAELKASLTDPAAILRQHDAELTKRIDEEWTSAMDSVWEEMRDGAHFENPMLAAAARTMLNREKARKGEL